MHQETTKFMKQRIIIRNKLLSKISILAGFIVLIVLCMVFLKKQMSQKDLLSYADNFTDFVVKDLEKEFLQIQTNIDALAQIVNENVEEENITKILAEQELAMKRCKHLDGLLVAFEKDYLKNYPGLYSPYIRREDGEYILLQVSDAYDYTSDDAGAVWYQGPVKRKRAEWVGPIYGKAGGRKLFMYCVPVQINGEIIGLVAACYNLMEIYQILQNTGAGRIGFPYLINQKGEFIAHPNNENKNLVQLAIESDDNALKELSKDIYRLSFQGKKYYHKNSLTGKFCWELIKPIESVSIFLGISINDNQIYGNPSYRNKKRRDIFTYSLLIFTILLCLLYIIIFKTDLFKSKFLIFVMFFSLISIMEIGVITMFTVYYPVIGINKKESQDIERKKTEIINRYHQNSKDSITYTVNRWNFSMMLDNYGLFDYLQNYKEVIAHKTKKVVKEAPTGLYLQTIKFKDSHSTDITGYIWQKYPLNWTDKKGVIFPDAEKSKIILEDSSRIFNINGEIVDLYRWYFEVSIREPFNFSHYPLDRNDLWLRLWHKNYDQDIILVPDFSAYSLINPSFSPGLDSGIDMPGWIIEGSFFSYKEKTYNSSFGKEIYNSKNYFPELHFNVMLHRDFSDPLICKVIPLMVLLFMMYSILFIGGFTEQLNVVIGCSGLFFVAIFEHIHLRQSLNASGIIYLEYLYFITYLLLLLITYSAMRNDIVMNIGWRKVSIIDFAKLCFWPLFFFLILMISVCTFY